MPQADSFTCTGLSDYCDEKERRGDERIVIHDEKQWPGQVCKKDDGKMVTSCSLGFLGSFFPLTKKNAFEKTRGSANKWSGTALAGERRTCRSR